MSKLTLVSPSNRHEYKSQNSHGLIQAIVNERSIVKMNGLENKIHVHVQFVGSPKRMTNFVVPLAPPQLKG